MLYPPDKLAAQNRYCGIISHTSPCLYTIRPNHTHTPYSIYSVPCVLVDVLDRWYKYTSHTVGITGHWPVGLEANSPTATVLNLRPVQGR